MQKPFIDVWNTESYDDALLKLLRLHSAMIIDYLRTESQNFHDLELSNHRSLPPKNIYERPYLSFMEELSKFLYCRVIRSWHYTRLTRDEILIVKNDGIYPGTLQTIRGRLDARVAAGDIQVEVANALFAESPFQNQQQFDVRSGRFWLTSHPLEQDDSGVRLLLNNWGGEGVYFYLNDRNLITVVQNIGNPCIIEMLIPMSTTPHSYRAAEAVLRIFARSIGCGSARSSFDLYTTHSLGPEAVVAVHTNGDRHFSIFARGYPADFVHLDSFI